MKRVFSVLLALAIVLSLGVTAFAEGETGSITVTNATYGHKYSAYKVFNAKIVYEKDANGNPTQTVAGVAYSIDPDSQFFVPLFGENGTAENKFFEYNPNSHEVKKRDGVNNSELVSHLNELVKTHKADLNPTGKSILAVEEGKSATDYPGVAYDPQKDTIQYSTQIKFENLPYGYYIVTSTLGTSVTINSNTPDVEVIDKNQKPAVDFKKQISIGKDAEDNDVWGDENSANIGDTVTYRISFTATNYDEAKPIKYYQIHDEKGDAIWAEFSSFRVYVDGKELPRGYYLSVGGKNTGNWKLLGNLEATDGWKSIPEAEQDANDAQWYLVHQGYDQYRITIPWMDGHSLTTTTGGDGKTTYKLEFAETTFKYPSPATVEVIYHAAVEANASIGTTSHGNRFNKASASWTSEHETGSTSPDEVVTRVYGIGLLKDDSDTGVNLAGAKFKIYRSYDDKTKTYDNDVNVIPTGIRGVYAIDSVGAHIEDYTGTGKVPTREYYSVLRDASGNEIKNGDNPIENQELKDWGDKVSNEVITPENGKVVILGLEAGTYYLCETQAPTGYNGLSTPIKLEVNAKTARPFHVFADNQGNVADIQENEGTFVGRQYEVTQTIVSNSKGEVLPATGGEGRMMLITIGTMVAIGFAVLMITQKKMSLYRD